MFKLKRRNSSKRRLNSASSSTAGSVSDLDDRVIMLCEDIPAENSFDSGRGSQSPEARSSSGSKSQDQNGSAQPGAEPQIIHLSRDRTSYRRARYIDGYPRKGSYRQRVVHVYGINIQFITALTNMWWCSSRFPDRNLIKITIHMIAIT